MYQGGQSLPLNRDFKTLNKCSCCSKCAVLSRGQEIPHTTNHVSTELESLKVALGEPEWVTSLGIRNRVGPGMSKGGTLIRNSCAGHKLALFHNFARGPTL